MIKKSDMKLWIWSKNHVTEFKASVIEISNMPILRNFGNRRVIFDIRMVSDLKLLVDNRRISIVHQMENQFWSDLGY